MSRDLLVILCGAALLIAAVVAVVVASRNRHQPAPPPDVLVAVSPAEVRVKAVGFRGSDPGEYVAVNMSLRDKSWCDILRAK